jgi:hypothetical protein
MFEFSSENSRIGFKLSELALRIIENEELSSFVGKIGSKLSRDGQVNDFEKAVLTQVFENFKIADRDTAERKDMKESTELDSFFDKYILNFY